MQVQGSAFKLSDLVSERRASKQKKGNSAEFLITQTILIVARTINQAFLLTACNALGFLLLSLVANGSE